MNYLEIIGSLTLWLFAVAAACIALICTFESGYKILDRLITRHEDLIRRKVGNQIFNESYWFSENFEVRMILEVLGRRLEREGWYRTENIREEWRREIAKEKKP